MIKALAVFERTTCACQSCKAVCTSGRPGCLAPSDLDRIAEYFGMEGADTPFVLANFGAYDDGPEVAVTPMVNAVAPAIRPRVRADGSCVFLGSQGQCTIHPVAPFECGRTLACDQTSGSAAMKALGKSIVKSAEYVMVWLQMWRQQQHQPPASL